MAEKRPDVGFDHQTLNLQTLNLLRGGLKVRLGVVQKIIEKLATGDLIGRSIAKLAADLFAQ